MSIEDKEYRIRVTPWHRWRGDYGWEYSNDSDHEYELCGDTIDELYEQIARDYNSWILKIEDGANQRNPSDYQMIENNGINYSPIFINVEEYSDKKRNATRAYKQNISAKPVPK